MQTTFLVRCAALGATLTLLGAGCSTTTSLDTAPAATGTKTTTSTTDPAPPVVTGVEVNAGGSTAVVTDAVPAPVAMVTLTGDGFSPTSITVKKGTKVTFTNKGSTSHWPASDPHPTHTDYPEFDPKHEIKTGESWTFTFDKVGTWRYHDHLNSGEKGVVIVTE